MRARLAVRLRRYVVAGLLIWLPLGATIVVFRLLLGLMDRLLFWLPADYRPEALIGFPAPGLDEAVAFALAVTLLLGTGALGANLLGRRLLHAYEGLMHRIPFVRTVYGGVKKFSEVVFAESGSAFKKVLLIQYPRPGVYSLCFKTSDDLEEVQAKTGETVITAFLPTTPNPTSGFIIFVPVEDVVELDMSVEDALKMIISLGVVVPKWHPLHPAADRATPAGLPGSGAAAGPPTINAPRSAAR
jgi:uncharacterized membrane protein